MNLTKDLKKENNGIFSNSREDWVDYTKVFACILVVIGHLMQGLNTKGINFNNTLYSYIEIFIYLFHMPLFMCLSGYLYNKTKKINNVKDYFKFIKKKIINLGIPYIFFYLLHIGLNMIFAKDVNNALGLEEIFSIFVKPIAPFWFLYILIFIFIFIPIIEKVCKNNKKITLMVLTIAYLINIIFYTNIYLVDTFIKYAFYFYLGVVINEKMKNKLKESKVILNTILYVMLSIAYYYFSPKITSQIVIKTMLMILAVLGIFVSISIFIKAESRIKQSKTWNFLRKYTFQIYLLHTIFTAGIRILLIKLSINNFYIHFIMGMIFGIIGPIIVSIIAEKSRYLNILFFPLKSIEKIKETRKAEKNENSNDWA